MTRVALYARYSSDNQREASIEDQLRLCREHAAKMGWAIIGCYTDRAVSGASLLRPGIQELLQDAQRHRFDLVLSEALDRISRDQEDVAAVFKRLAFADVGMTTLSEGDITALHVGLKGTMNALFLRDLAAKVHRGLRGRVEAGKSGGGLCYGYRALKQFDASGERIRGEREIDEAQATIVRQSAAPGSSTTSSISASSSGTGSATSRIPAPAGASRASTHRTPGSRPTRPISASSMMRSGRR